MSVPRINKIVEHWQYVAPPAYKSLAASIGFKPKVRATKHVEISEEENERNAAALMAMFPMTRGKPQPRPKNLPPPGEKNV